MDEDLKRLFRSLYFLSTVGLSMALAIAIGVGIGYWLDKKLGTSPWMLLIFFGFGIVAAFRNLYYMYKKGKKYFE